MGFRIMSTCANCNNSMSSHSHFCAICGQSVISFQRPIKPVLMEMIHETLDIDGRLFLTLKTLILKPGLLSLEYNQGKRMKYTPPLRMYLVISILFFLFISLLPDSTFDVNRNAASNSEYYPKIMFLVLPFFAAILQLMYKQTFYLSNLVFSIHLHCMAFIVFMITFPLEAIEKIHPIFLILQIPLLLYLFSYFAFSLKRYYAQSWPITLIKFISLIFIYIFVVGSAFVAILKMTA